MNYKLQSNYEAKILFEASVAIDGTSYLIIYGEHVNGNFCCVPEQGWGCEMSDPSDTFYNSRSLINSGAPETIATYISQAIKDKSDELEANQKEFEAQNNDRALIEQLKSDTANRDRSDNGPAISI